MLLAFRLRTQASPPGLLGQKGPGGGWGPGLGGDAPGTTGKKDEKVESWLPCLVKHIKIWKLPKLSRMLLMLHDESVLAWFVWAHNIS